MNIKDLEARALQLRIDSLRSTRQVVLVIRQHVYLRQTLCRFFFFKDEF